MTVITYNVRGLLRVVDRDGLGESVVDPDPFRFTALVGTVAAERLADFVLLQEICGSQAEAIAEASRRKGHPMHLVAWDDFPNSEPRYQQARKVCENDELPPGAPVRYGRAILSTRAGDIPIDPPPGVRALCIVQPSEPPLRVCNVHVDRGELNYFPFKSWAAAGPLILGGDFNTAPDEPQMPSFYDDAAMFEADPSNAPTDGGPIATKKIDYIFADVVHFGESLRGDVLQMLCAVPPGDLTWCSDHRMLIGHFPFATEPQARDEGLCEIPSDQQILDQLPYWLVLPPPVAAQAVEVVEKECVEGFLVIEVWATFNGRVWTGVFAEHYRDCFMTQHCEAHGGGVSWWASDPDGAPDPFPSAAGPPCVEALAPPVGPPSPDEPEHLPPAVRSAICDMAGRI